MTHYAYPAVDAAAAGGAAGVSEVGCRSGLTGAGRASVALGRRGSMNVVLLKARDEGINELVNE